MIDLYKLIEKFSLKGVLDFERRTNGFIFLTISNQYANAEICLYGAQITSYKPVNKPDILWMSSKSNFEAGKAIRGGIPVCFPWFGPHKTDSHKPQHGFGRLMFWSVTKTAVSASGETLISLQLNFLGTDESLLALRIYCGDEHTGWKNTKCNTYHNK